MIVVDTSVWVDYFNGAATPKTDLLDDLLGRERIITGDLILAELLQGFRLERDFRAARALLSRLEYRDMVGRDVAVDAARHYRALRARGITPRKTIDVLIGTFCLRNKLPLLHDDRDFEPMERWLGLNGG